VDDDKAHGVHGFHSLRVVACHAFDCSQAPEVLDDDKAVTKDDVDVKDEEMLVLMAEDPAEVKDTHKTKKREEKKMGKNEEKKAHHTCAPLRSNSNCEAGG
jgi:hypothetical protein